MGSDAAGARARDTRARGSHKAGSAQPDCGSSPDDQGAAGAPRQPEAGPAAAVPEYPAGTPLVFEVGKLGARRYWAWVNRPAPGQPRFFASDFAESISKVEWWVVPALWLPLWAAATAASLAVAHTPPARLAALQLAGVVLWQALEYGIHRWVFHAPAASYWAITAHFLFHGCHHKFPSDGQRLVFPPVPAAAIAAAIWGGLRLAWRWQTALGLMGGMTAGYVAYDCLHYAIHHGWQLPGPLLRELRRRHNHHHYNVHDRGYGISSRLFDVLLRTSAQLP